MPISWSLIIGWIDMYIIILKVSLKEVSRQVKYTLKTPGSHQAVTKYKAASRFEDLERE